MKPEERLELIDALLDGVISEADFLRLEAQLHVDPAARRDYYERLKLDTILSVSYSSEQDAETLESPPVDRLRDLAMILVAMSLLIALLGIVWWNPGSGGEGGGKETAEGYAIMGDQHEAVWAGMNPRSGEFVPLGPLQLLSGLASVDLLSGVSLVVEGAVDFEILSPMEMVVSSGKIRAEVPPAARGFRVHTNDGEIVDLGTEFALQVNAAGSELHVLDGEVEWHPEESASQLLQTGQALAWSSEGTALSRPAETERFSGLSEIQRRKSERRARWEQQLQAVSADPRLIVHYPMASLDEQDRLLINNAASGSEFDGAIIATDHHKGRWGKGGLHFSPAGSRVRTHVEGSFSGLTLLAWVNINSLEQEWNSLFLTDGYEVGEPHWQLLPDGQLFFSVKPEVVGHVPLLSPAWTPDDAGRWLMLASTYDGTSGEIRHYRDGELIGQSTLPEAKRVSEITIGGATIGNWSLPYRAEPEFAIRNLDGIIDEFALYKAALSSDEIAALYLIGKP